jgi:endonuclease-3 related protein
MKTLREMWLKVNLESRRADDVISSMMIDSGTDIGDTVRKVYGLLFEEYGSQGWWPVTRSKGGEPRYLGGPRDAGERFEVAAGAVLTQNTSWSNAARAVSALSGAGLLDPARLAVAPPDELAALIRSSGYYNQKAERLRVLARYFLDIGEGVPDRESLLALKGIGPETADSILLYGFSLTFFVVDAYTNRLFSRLGVIRGDESHDRIKDLFEVSLEKSPRIYNEYHALIVEHCKRRCRRVPVCGACPISALCASECSREGG